MTGDIHIGHSHDLAMMVFRHAIGVSHVFGDRDYEGRWRSATSWTNRNVWQRASKRDPHRRDLPRPV